MAEGHADEDAWVGVKCAEAQPFFGRGKHLPYAVILSVTKNLLRLAEYGQVTIPQSASLPAPFTQRGLWIYPRADVSIRPYSFNAQNKKDFRVGESPFHEYRSR